MVWGWNKRHELHVDRKIPNQITRIMLTIKEPKQTDPIFLSSDEDTTSEYPMSDEYSSEDNNYQVQTVSQFLVHPNDPTGAAQVTISS